MSSTAVKKRGAPIAGWLGDRPALLVGGAVAVALSPLAGENLREGCPDRGSAYCSGMAPALRINTNSRRCVVPLDEIHALARELRLGNNAYPGATSVATILEAAAAEETAADVTFTNEEEAAISRALHGMEVEGGRLPDGLQMLWDGIRIDSGSI